MFIIACVALSSASPGQPQTGLVATRQGVAAEGASSPKHPESSPSRFALTDPDAKVIAALIGTVGLFITLVGTVLTGAVALLGHRYRLAIERRNLDLKASADARHALQQQHENNVAEQGRARLQLEREADRQLAEREDRRESIETMLTAVQLLGTDSGQDASSTQRAGALFALAKLEQLGFAIVLLESMLPQRRVDAHTAVWLINEALVSEPSGLQEQAAALLRDNSERLLVDGGDYLWPRCIDQKWNQELPSLAKESLLQALIDVSGRRCPSDWHPDTLIGIHNTLHCMRSDSDSNIRAGASLASLAILDAIADEYGEIALPDHQRVSVKELQAALREEVEAHEPSSNATGTTLMLIQELEKKWE